MARISAMLRGLPSGMPRDHDSIFAQLQKLIDEHEQARAKAEAFLPVLIFNRERVGGHVDSGPRADRCSGAAGEICSCQSPRDDKQYKRIPDHAKALQLYHYERVRRGVDVGPLSQRCSSAAKDLHSCKIKRSGYQHDDARYRKDGMWFDDRDQSRELKMEKKVCPRYRAQHRKGST